MHAERSTALGGGVHSDNRIEVGRYRSQSKNRIILLQKYRINIDTSAHVNVVTLCMSVSGQCLNSQRVYWHPRSQFRSGEACAASGLFHELAHNLCHRMSVEQVDRETDPPEILLIEMTAWSRRHFWSVLGHIGN